MFAVRPKDTILNSGIVGLIFKTPWTVAFAFGLLQGLGFAGALLNMRLPANGTVSALVGFNLGVELGQIVF